MATPREDPPLDDTPSVQDHYAEHLADVNKDVDVVATEDIVNQHGVLIAPKGARIDHAASKRLIQHKLTHPLEQQVQLSQNIDGNSIYSAWLQLMPKYPDLAYMHTTLGFEQTYQQALATLDIHPLITQKLTVMSRQMPEWFEKAMFCAWMAALVVREMGLDNPTLKAAIVASLSHDVGFLHIDPRILAKRGQLIPEEWRTIQAHVVIGQLFLADLPDMDKRIPCAVLEHHERCDGTGYPFGKTSQSLELLGKIIGLADSLQAIRINQFTASGHTLRDAMPYLQMNDFTHSVEVYRAATAILKKSGLQPACIDPYNSIAVWAQRISRRCSVLMEIRESLTQFQELLLEDMVGKSQFGTVLLAVINNLFTKITSAGLEGDQVLTWLASCKDGEQNVLAEINESHLIVNELIWHVNHVHRTAEGYLDKNCHPDHTACQTMSGILKQIGAQLILLRDEEKK